MVRCAGGCVIERVQEVADHPLMVIGGKRDQTRRQCVHDAKVGGLTGDGIEGKIRQIADDGLVRKVANGFAEALRLRVDHVRILVSAGVGIGGLIRLQRGAEREQDHGANAGRKPERVTDDFSRRWHGENSE